MENNQITVTDLITLRNIVDLACTRGAFRANEMTQVGETYDKLAKFLDEIIEQAQAQNQSESGAESDQPQGEIK